jgi:cell division protein FtsB
MRTLIILLVVVLVGLQVKLWVGNGSFAEVWRYSRAVNEQQQENARLEERNKTLDAEVLDLKQGLESIEERARSELGMVKQNETFFQIIEESHVKP